MSIARDNFQSIARAQHSLGGVARVSHLLDALYAAQSCRRASHISSVTSPLPLRFESHLLLKLLITMDLRAGSFRKCVAAVEWEYKTEDDPC